MSNVNIILLLIWRYPNTKRAWLSIQLIKFSIYFCIYDYSRHCTAPLLLLYTSLLFNKGFPQIYWLIIILPKHPRRKSKSHFSSLSCSFSQSCYSTGSWRYKYYLVWLWSYNRSNCLDLYIGSGNLPNDGRYDLRSRLMDEVLGFLQENARCVEMRVPLDRIV